MAGLQLPKWATAAVIAAGCWSAAMSQEAPRRAAEGATHEPGSRNAGTTTPVIPPVTLSAGHAKLCRVLVGDEFPAMELPRRDAGPTKLATFSGERATVVLFWTPGAWMSRAALTDIGRDVAAKARDSTVGVVGVVTGGTPDEAQAELDTSGAKFSQLVDADGKALALVGAEALPRVYVLDGEHRIAWFDLEYSEATRRELAQTLAALTAAK